MIALVDGKNRWFVLFVLLTAIVGFGLRDVAYDDPYITYRYAQNLVAGQGFVYNAGQRALSTTAPLYAFLLAIGGVLWPDLPHLSNLIGALSLLVAGSFVYLTAERFGHRWAALVAGLLFILCPLVWTTAGFETRFYLMLACGAFYFYHVQNLPLMAVFLALALLTRGDGIIPALVLFGYYVVDVATTSVVRPRGNNERSLLKSLLQALALYAAIVAPFFVYLTVAFGSPLPATLRAKALQMKMGITGFYPGSTFFEGAFILAAGLVEQSGLYLLFAPAVLWGLWAIWKKERWVGSFLLWAALHFVGYQLLGVAPYHWYYAALVPAIVLTAGLGLVEGGRRLAVRFPRGGMVVSVALAFCLLGAEAVSLSEIHRAMAGEKALTPQDKMYKTLPEIKTAVYRQVGEWLAAHTDPQATVGLMEVGVIGYYSERRIVDFLGLIQPEVARALSYRNLYWAIPHYRPDYIALVEVNPLYAYYLGDDQWFRRVYAAVQTFSDERFWAGPVTIYRRQEAARPMQARRLEANFGGRAQLVGYRFDREEVRPGETVCLSLLWRSLAAFDREYSGFLHLVDGQGQIVQGEDEIYATPLWPPGEVVEYYHNLVIPEELAAGRYDLAVGLYLPGEGPESAGQRLTVTESGQEAIILGSIQVGP